MNKLVYVIGAVLILGFIGMGAREMMQSQSPYVETVAEVKSAPAGSSVQFIGTIVPGKAKYSADGKQLTFFMKDKDGETLCVRFDGVKPQNFDTAPKAVVRGIYKNSDFHADQVLLKCPSKYEGK